MSRTLATFAALSLGAGACMYDAGSDAAAITAADPGSIAIQARSAHIDDGHMVITDPAFGKYLLVVDVVCGDAGWARVNVEASTPADEIEVRGELEYKPGPNGRWYPMRVSYPAEPLLRAPGTRTYPYAADVPMDGTCDDLKAQLRDVRGTFDGKNALFDLHPAI